MSPFETATATQAYRDRCEDSVAVFPSAARLVVVVADGAGGTGAGDRAATAALAEVERAIPTVHSASEWTALLRQIDCRIVDGETTLVVVDVRPFGIAGASVGDSQAVIVADNGLENLTAHQHRKPLLGSGSAEPVGFMSSPLIGTLLVATDGFFNYAKPAAIEKLVATSEFMTLPRRGIELVRLPSGDFWDDVGIAVVRNKRPTSVRTFSLV